MNVHVNQITGDKFAVRNFEELVFIDDINTREYVITGGPGTGKTTLGIIKVLEKLYSGHIGSLTCRSLAHIRILFPEFKKWVEPNLILPKERYRISDKDWQLNSPATFNFKSGGVLFFQYGGYKHVYAPSNLNFAYLDGPVDSNTLEITRRNCRKLGPNGEKPQLWYSIGSLNLDYDFVKGAGVLNLGS